MTTITFDTLKFANRLKEAGVPDKQAEAMADIQRDLLATNLNDLVTREDLYRGLKELKLEIAAEIAPLKWGMAVCVGGVIALVLKAFFPH